MHTGPYVQRDRRKIHLDLNESHYPIPERVKTEIALAVDRLHEYSVGHEAEVVEDVTKFIESLPPE